MMATKTKSRPIIFTAEEVRATLENRKTMFRRPIKLRGFGPSRTPGFDWFFRDKRLVWNEVNTSRLLDICPFGQPGERLWVRETFQDSPDGIIYRADDGSETEYMAGDCPVWRPSVHMTKEFSRLTLEIVSVRVEMVQEIDPTVDPQCEGVAEMVSDDSLEEYSYRAGFKKLWNSRYAKRGFGWDVNPWVWVIEFKRVEKVV